MDLENTTRRLRRRGNGVIFPYMDVARPFSRRLKPIFHLATLFARRESKTRLRQRDWLKLAGEKIRREQVGTVPTFLSVRANKFANWKIGFRRRVVFSKSI